MVRFCRLLLFPSEYGLHPQDGEKTITFDRKRSIASERLRRDRRLNVNQVITSATQCF